jgi:hypothetical protein
MTTYPDAYPNIGLVATGYTVEADRANQVAENINAIAAVLTLNPPKASVRVATAAALPSSTFASSALTADANGALTIDGVGVTNGDRVLVKDETFARAAYNGLYVVTDAGSPTTPWVLTRAADMVLSSQVPGALVFVSEGNENEFRLLGTTADASFVLDASAMSWIEVTGAGQGVTALSATSAALPAYGASGNVLTASSSGALSVGGVAVAAGDVVLIKNETSTNAPFNGVYTVTDPGSVSTAWVLTRTPGVDTADRVLGTTPFVLTGGTLWALNGALPFTLNVTDITVSQLAGPPQSDVSMNGKKLTSLATPTTSGDAANKVYVDDLTRLWRAPQGRLAGTTDPLADTSGSGTGTLYYVPYVGNTAWVYYGGQYIPLAIPGDLMVYLQMSLSGLGTGLHDIFLYTSDGIALSLAHVAWTNTTTRATALAFSNGHYVLSTDTSKVYLGTIYTYSSRLYDYQYAVSSSYIMGWRTIYNLYNQVRRLSVTGYGGVYAVSASGSFTRVTPVGYATANFVLGLPSVIEYGGGISYCAFGTGQSYYEIAVGIDGGVSSSLTGIAENVNVNGAQVTGAITQNAGLHDYALSYACNGSGTQFYYPTVFARGMA